MTSDEDELRRLFQRAAPDLPAPEDRMSAVGARVRRTRRLRTAGVAGAALAVVLAAGLPSLLPERPEDSTPAAARTDGCASPRPTPSDQAGLSEIANRLTVGGTTRFADSYGETRLLADRVQVLRKPSAAFDAWVKDEFRADCVELTDSAYSAQGVEQILDQVRADRDYWESRGVVLRTLSVDVNGTITIGVPPDQVKTARAAVPARYDHPVVVEPQEPIELPTGTD